MMQTMFVGWRKKCLVLVTVLAAKGAAALTCATSPAVPDWDMVYHSDTLRLYEPAHLTGPPELIASVQWRTLPEPLYRIIWNYAQFQQNIPGVRKSEVLLTENGHKWVYQQLELPGPLKDRHYILESSNTDSLPEQHHYQVKWKLSQRFPLPDDNLVSPSAFSGCWNIQAAGKDGLIAQYRIQLDPAGNVPRWIAQRGMRRYVKQLVEQLHHQLLAPEDRKP
ncbi:hypothetical protein MNBD_GAMMA15-1945 [hydrothermal vent metagenome]|uniref:Coenzyme Q-binding protein COQ10 START domain-containing protein n=1 Tax=hydrothermal vent metagenome TaxID=652676 RepID=A0A3B0YLM1_9ZZZZ